MGVLSAKSICRFLPWRQIITLSDPISWPRPSYILLFPFHEWVSNRSTEWPQIREPVEVAVVPLTQCTFKMSLYEFTLKMLLYTRFCHFVCILGKQHLMLNIFFVNFKEYFFKASLLEFDSESYWGCTVNGTTFSFWNSGQWRHEAKG